MRSSVTIGNEFDTKVLQQLDDLQVRLAEQVREVNRLEYQVEETRERIPGCAVDAWYGQDQFTAFFRGGSDDLRSRYAELAKEFIECEPVVDLGFGRGEFMELLTELGVAVHGVEPDLQLVTTARVDAGSTSSRDSQWSTCGVSSPAASVGS